MYVYVQIHIYICDSNVLLESVVQNVASEKISENEIFKFMNT